MEVGVDLNTQMLVDLPLSSAVSLDQVSGEASWEALWLHQLPSPSSHISGQKGHPRCWFLSAQTCPDRSHSVSIQNQPVG